MVKGVGLFLLPLSSDFFLFPLHSPKFDKALQLISEKSSILFLAMASSMATLRSTFGSSPAFIPALIKKIHRKATISPLNEFSSLLPLSTLLALSAESEVRYSSGTSRSPLEGVPIAIKANIAYHNDARYHGNESSDTSDGDVITTTASSAMLEGYTSPFDATCVRKLKDAGAIIVGSTRMDEFGMGNTGSSSSKSYSEGNGGCERVYLRRAEGEQSLLPGGSSGGSAASVVNGTSIASLGSDTGGSVRLPASLCGLVGFKPCYGSVSRLGLIAYGSSLDCIGVIGNNVEDVRCVYDVIKGPDDGDMNTTSRPSTPLTSPTSSTLEEEGSNMFDISTVAVGVPSAYTIRGTPPAITDAWVKALSLASSAGVRSVSQIASEEGDVALVKASLPAYYVIACAEASSNLARYDGMQFGARNDASTAATPSAVESKNETFHQSISDLRAGRFGPEVVKRILAGTAVLSREGGGSGYYDSAMVVREEIGAMFDRWFEKCDVIVIPTTMVTEIVEGRPPVDSVTELGWDIYTVGVSLGGFSAISIPMEENIGIQIVGKSDELVLNVAEKIMQMK